MLLRDRVLSSYDEETEKEHIIKHVPIIEQGKKTHVPNFIKRIVLAHCLVLKLSNGALNIYLDLSVGKQILQPDLIFDALNLCLALNHLQRIA